MGFSSKPLCLLCTTLIFFLCFELVKPELDYNNLVFKNCSKFTSSYPNVSFSQILSSLLQEFIVHSSKLKFFQTASGDEKIAILGLFQCRGDLTNEECNNCVNRLPEKLDISCGEAIPARVQLSGCYIRYQAEGPKTSRHDVIHKSCGEAKADSTIGFGELRDAAFAALESCVNNNGDGFCDMSYKSIHVMGQCEGTLNGCDCGECVNDAVQIAQYECRDSLSGEIYLSNCFISYSYYPSSGSMNQDTGSGGGTSVKLVAIVVGGIAALSLFLVLWRYSRSWRKKQDDW